jgi:ribosome-associated toxin RatA of RatAB toxin-antitoxin module
MMRTVDLLETTASPARMFAVARDVERWPERLPHYRFVRMLLGSTARGIVAMSANRPFGKLNWPTWWTSEMWIDPVRRAVHYRHIEGVTTGMVVEWRIDPTPTGARVTLTHEWEGPPWGPLRRPAAEWVIGPVFVHGIATRTLAGLARHAENSND